MLQPSLLFKGCRFEVDALIIDHHNTMVTQHLFEDLFTNSRLIHPLHFE